MTLQLVPGMKESPAVCMFCHGNPPNEDQSLGPAVTDPDVDYDWGETPYICHECGNVIGTLFGLVSAEESKKLLRRNKDLEAQLEELGAEHQALNERINRILDGNRAKSEQKAKKKAAAK